MKKSPLVRAGLAASALLLALAILVPGFATGAAKSNKALVAAHGKALAECSAEGLVNGYTADATLFFPDGVVVKGRKSADRTLRRVRQVAGRRRPLRTQVAKPVLEWESRRHLVRQVQGDGTVPRQAVLLDRRLRLQGRQDRRRDVDLRRDQTRPQEDEVGGADGVGAAARPVRSSRRSTFPEAVFGSSSTRWTTWGAL